MAQQGQLAGRWLLARSSRTAARDPGLRRSVKISDVARTKSQASAGDMIRSLALILIPLVVITIIFTNTPDEHFIIDRLPDHDRVLVVSACSGHGFKFASVIGEIVADLVTMAESRFDLKLFSLKRFP